MIETIAAELERPRELTPQVIKHLDGTYGIDRDAIAPFLKDELPRLEDYEHDLILSPLFTPKLTDQAVLAELLGGQSIPREEWPALIQELVNRPIHAHLITSDRQSHRVHLREVSIERFVHRLRLDGTISQSLLSLIEKAPVADHPLLKAVARRAIWEKDTRRDIFVRLLTTSLSDCTYLLSDSIELLRLAEDYQPADSSALAARIPRWQKLLEEEINTAHDQKPFFSQTIQYAHGGNDQRKGDEARAAAKREDLAFLKRLQGLLADTE